MLTSRQINQSFCSLLTKKSPEWNGQKEKSCRFAFQFALFLLRPDKLLTPEFVFFYGAAFQISRQVKGHEGSVFCLCQMRSGTLLSGGGKDRKVILWDHHVRAERDIEVGVRAAHARTHARTRAYLSLVTRDLSRRVGV